MTKTEFTELVLPSKEKLFRVAAALLRDRQEAEDALQEVYLKLWNMREKLPAYDSVEALGVTMIKNLCLDRLRSYRHRKRDERELESLKLSPGRGGPERAAELKESMKALHRIIGSLPERQRLVMQLRDIEQYEYEEIASMTGLTVNNIRVTLSRARKSVRNQYLKHRDYEHGTD